MPDEQTVTDPQQGSTGSEEQNTVPAAETSVSEASLENAAAQETESEDGNEPGEEVSGEGGED